MIEETRLFSFIQHYWKDFRSRSAARIKASQTSHNHFFFHINDISFLIFWTYTTAEMTLPYSQSVTTLKRVTVEEPSTRTVLTSTPVGISDSSTTYRTVNLAEAQLQPSSPVGISEGSTTYRTVNLGATQLQPVQYINSQMEGNVMYGGARYLVPVQQRPAESYVYLSQAPRVMQQVYLQNVQPISVSSVDETDVYRQVVSVNFYF